MIIALIACLIIVCLYLAKRLSDVTSENTTQREQIASLKRQLVRRRNTART